MSFVGGDIISITYNHSILGSGILSCKANEDGIIEPGGYRSNDDDNSSTGDGKFIDQMNWRRASVELPPIMWDMTDTNEQDQLKKLAASPILADWTIQHVSGQIWGGRGKPVGDLPGATNTAQITLKLAFDGELKRLA